MGLIQMGFGASQVLGIPISLFIANYYGWEAPFFLVVGIAICVALGILTIMQPVDKHLALQGAHTNPVQHLLNTVAKRDYRIGFTATALLAIGGFMMMPFSSAFAVNNLKVSTHDLPALFMISGVTSLVVMPILGRLSDKFDRFKIFAIAALYMSVVIVLYTHLTPKPLWFVMGFNVLMMAGILGRMVPASAIVTAVPGPADRGAFMSINSSLQQIAGGIAAMIGGLIVYRQSEVSPLEHYDVLGYVVAGITLLSIYLIGRVDKMIKKRLPADDTTQPVIEEHQPA
jgi:predicted MFS family arabinose efflux permease